MSVDASGADPTAGRPHAPSDAASDASAATSSGAPSDAQLAAIVALAADAIISLDHEQRITLFNEGAERIFGYTQAEVIGKPLGMLLPDGVRVRHEAHVHQFSAAPETARRMGERREIAGRRRTGETFPAEASIAKMRTTSGWTYLTILRDISDVRRREHQLSQAQSMAHLGGWEWDIDNNVVTWTDELYRIYGLEQGAVELSIETFMERLLPADRQNTRAAIDRALATGQPFDYEERIVRPDGVVRLLRSTGEVVTDGAGRPIRLLGVCQDITERRESEAKARELEREQAARAAAEQAADMLRESEERFRMVADTAPVLIWMAEPDGSCSFVNRSWLDFTGRTLDDERGFGWLPGVHPDDAQRCMDTYMTAIRRRERYEMQYRLRRHDDEYRWLLDHGVPRFLPDGEFAGFIGSCADITDQIEQQDALREANQRLEQVGAELRVQLGQVQVLNRELSRAGEAAHRARSAAERLADRIVRLQQLTAALSEARTVAQVAAVVMDQGLTLLEADRGAIGTLSGDGRGIDFVRMEGFTEAAEQAYHAITIDDDLPAAEALRTGEPVWIRSADEYRRRYPEAFERLHNVKVIEIVAALPLSDSMERPLGVLVVAFPNAAAFGVTDEAFTSLIGQVAGPAMQRAQAYDDERAGRKRAEAAARAREEALAVVAHDLRNPLNLIASNALLLRDHDLDMERRRRLVEITERSVRQMDRLITDLLDEARIEAGRFTVDTADIAVGDLVDEVVQSLRPEAELKGLRLSRSVPDLPRVRADRDRVLQVLHNLVGNALKFTEQGEVEVSMRADGDCLTCTVRDTGPGIPEHHAPRLFERYWQANRRDRRGAGLGLPIAKGIIEAHGGRIWVESVAGSGSTFYFTLPLAASPAAAG